MITITSCNYPYKAVCLPKLAYVSHIFFLYVAICSDKNWRSFNLIAWGDDEAWVSLIFICGKLAG